MDYHLRPLSKTCAATGRELQPGDRCFSVLMDEGGELVRKDYAEDAWPGAPSDAIGVWQTIVPEPEPEAARPLDTDALMRYFEQLSEDLNPAQERFRYILALLLVQKRRLKLEGSRRDGELEFLELVGAQGEGNFSVRDCNLSDSEIDQLQRDLNRHLQTEWS